MYSKNVTEHEKKLFDALVEEGIYCELGFCDGKKCVDLTIPRLRLYIEIDGMQHYTDPEQILTDIKRDQYSEKDGFDTLRIPNTAIDKDLSKIVKAIRQISARRDTERKL